MEKNYNKSQIALMELTSVPNLTYHQKDMILSLVDAPEDLWKNLYELQGDLEYISEGLFERLQAVNDRFNADKLLLYMQKINAYALFQDDADYPSSFDCLEDKPFVLYCKGDAKLLSTECFAIVGTRVPTRYGKDVTEIFAREIANVGFTIVSGLARGVDSIAHRIALECEKKTVGVIGCGVDLIYPAENKELYDSMSENGLIISEYFFGESALPYHFPERNRLISALSQGLLVTEAGLKSGTLITVNCALDQGKDVFLVPGNIFNKASEGTNEMLHNPQCLIACKPDDVLEYYRKESAIKKEEVQLTAEEAIVFAELQSEDKHFEELIEATGLSMKDLLATLTKLEVFGVIKKLPGNYYGI